MTKMSFKTSTGVNFFGVHWVVIYMRRIIEAFPEYRDNIFSIGSGNGYMEAVINKCCNVDIKCVDPEPNSYMKGSIYKHPQYKTVDDIESRYIDNCILFINWATPQQFFGYDIDSIMKLKPKCIFFVGELGMTRAANSIVFHEFLKFNNILTFGCYNSAMDECKKPDDVDFSEFRYNVNAKSDCNIFRNDLRVTLNFTLCCLSHSDIKFDLPSQLVPAGMKNSSEINGKKYADEISIILTDILWILPFYEQAIARCSRHN